MAMKYGDIYLLGQHRLMCGDATKRDDVLKLVGNEKINLVLTDPPYGMKCQSKDGAIGGSKKFTGVIFMRNGKPREPRILNAIKRPQLIGDNSSESARKNYEIVKDLADTLIFWGGQYFADFLPVSGGWLFWDKRNTGNSFSDGELAWTNKGKRVRKYTFLQNGCCRQGSRKLAGGLTLLHPTQKPVELHMQILQDFSHEWDVVLDCFGGSGTTLIACEQVGRKCLMMEISEDYCNIICDRFQKLTGIQPVKEGENEDVE